VSAVDDVAGISARLCLLLKLSIALLLLLLLLLLLHLFLLLLLLLLLLLSEPYTGSHSSLASSTSRREVGTFE